VGQEALSRTDWKGTQGANTRWLRHHDVGRQPTLFTVGVVERNLWSQRHPNGTFRLNQQYASRGRYSICYACVALRLDRY